MSTADAEDDGRAVALAEIRRLVLAHELTVEDVRGVLPEPGRPGNAMPRALGYLGGLFLFAGIAAFIAINWDSFPSLARVLVTLGVGVSLFVSAVVVDRQRIWPAYATPAYLAAEVLQPTGILVAFEEYGSGGDWRIALIAMGAVISLQALSVLRLSANSVLVFASIFFAALATANAFDLADVPEGLTAIAVGGALVLVALGLDRQRFPWNVSSWAGFGSLLFYLGAFDLLKDTTPEAGFVVLAAGGVYISVQTRIRALLATSVLALLLYISYFTVEHFSDSLGWPVALMLIGLAFVGLGLLAVRFNRRYFQ